MNKLAGVAILLFASLLLIVSPAITGSAAAAVKPTVIKIPPPAIVGQAVSPPKMPAAGKHAICMFGRCSETIFASSHRLSVPEPCRGMHLKPVLSMHGTWICKRYGRS
jgi:hypothetical protein